MPLTIATVPVAAAPGRVTSPHRGAVENLDLVIPAGSLCGFIGPNGAGKTTTIRMIMSIIFPDSGKLEVLGRKSAIESKDRIGYLPEERGVYRKMRVGQFLKYMARLKGVDSAGLDTKVREWLGRVDLADCYRKKSEELSKGMQQKVQFIATVIHEPDLIILDEPFSGLDPVNSRLLRALIDEQHDAGRTIIFSTHQMSQAEALCDRVIMIHQGRKVLDNTPREVHSRFDARIVHVEPAAAGNGLVEAIRAVPGVTDVRENGHGFDVQIADDVNAASVVAPLAQVGEMLRLQVVKPTLEDIFIEIVQGSHASEAERQRLLDALRAGNQDGGVIRLATAGRGSDGSGD